MAYKYWIKSDSIVYADWLVYIGLCKRLLQKYVPSSPTVRENSIEETTDIIDSTSQLDHDVIQDSPVNLVEKLDGAMVVLDDELSPAEKNTPKRIVVKLMKTDTKYKHSKISPYQV